MKETNLLLSVSLKNEKIILIEHPLQVHYCDSCSGTLKINLNSALKEVTL